MKHPVLARVFSVTLAILCLILFLSGLSELRDERGEHAERLAFSEKYSGRIENYLALREETENSASYEEAAAALGRLLEEHEKNAAKHRTDMALFTAERGGYRMGEDLIVQIRAQMNEMRRELHDAKSLRSLLAGVINQALMEQKDRLPWLDSMTASALNSAGLCYQEGAKFTVAIVEITALIEEEPQLMKMLPDAPEPPPEPVMPDQPDPWGQSGWAGMDSGWAGMGGGWAGMGGGWAGMGGGWAGTPSGWAGMDGGWAVSASPEESYQAMADAYAQMAADYTQNMESYTQAMDDYAAAWETYSQELLEYQTALAEKSMYEVSAELYQQAHADWEQLCRETRSQVDFYEAARLIGAQRPLATALSGSSSAALQSMAAQLGTVPGLEELAALALSAYTQLEELSALDPAEMSNEEFLEKAGDAQDLLNMVADGFTAAAACLSNPGELIALAAEKLHVTDLLIQALDSMLGRADQEIQAQLENLWYSMGEVEKNRAKFEAEKLGLEEEALILQKHTLETDELRELKDRHFTARQLVLAVPEVRAASAADGEVEQHAKRYLQSYEEETGRLHKGRRLMCALAFAGGVIGAAGIPAAFEKLRGRFWLIAPAAVCLLCAAGADAVSMRLGLGQMYAALFTAIFALLQLLIVLPKKRRPAYAAKH